MAHRDLSTGDLFAQLGCVVFERGWLSSNNVLFWDEQGDGTLVDTGYSSHAAQTVALVRASLENRSLTAVLNTHLHSDHCGGNAVLQQVWDCSVRVPEASFEAASSWNEELLSYASTGQTCWRFSVGGALRPGELVRLGRYEWEVIAARGHDPDAVMLFEPASRTLIAGDVLWEDRLAINFPELVGEPGFDDAADSLSCIEGLNPSLVIPGHGRPFSNVSAAVSCSRSKLDRFRRDPLAHIEYALRALVMFRMLEVQQCSEGALMAWIETCPIFMRARGLCSTPLSSAAGIIQRLVGSDLLARRGEDLLVLGGEG
jgi:glyoxylase-like metal-dependent hydrolase (beta-lactamase superfamily II)